jgi:two-component system nitrogen regulation response regulator GlnG
VAGLPEGRVEVVTGSDVPAVDEGVLFLLFPAPSMEQLTKHRWPGNLREFAMSVENALTLSLAEAIAAGGHKRRGDEGRPDVIQIRPKVIRDQLMAVRIEDKSSGDGLPIGIQLRSHSGLNKVAQDIERQYFTTLYLRHHGDFAAMASILLGDADAARKVQLRFNQLGLRVRDLKERMS